MEALLYILQIIQKRDHYTLAHSRKVSILAPAIGEAMALPPHKIKILKTAALFHDIGKIAISPDILLKPGKLDDAEFEKIIMHPIYSGRLIDSICTEISHIALLHHERLDGSGYPWGVGAKKIPLEARILAVADVFSAMIEPRPYRPPHSPAEALAFLKKEAGIKFDYNVVETLDKIIPCLIPTLTSTTLFWRTPEGTC